MISINREVPSLICTHSLTHVLCKREKEEGHRRRMRRVFGVLVLNLGFGISYFVSFRDPLYVVIVKMY